MIATRGTASNLLLSRMMSLQTPPNAYPAYPVLPTSRLAVACLVVGIIAVLTMCFIPILPGAAAVILAIPAIQRTGQQKLAGRGMAVAGLAMGVVALFISLLSLNVWLPVILHGREAANRTDCAQKLQSIGQALRQYAVDGDGTFPPDLDTLIDAGGIDYGQVVCRSARESAGDEGDVLRFGENLSYIYLGKGISADAPPGTVIAYEPVSNHDRDGAHFLLADGSVRFILQTEARAYIDALNDGINPPAVQPTTLPTTQPATAPATGPTTAPAAPANP
jgi:competence protein ComGC